MDGTKEIFEDTAVTGEPAAGVNHLTAGASNISDGREQLLLDAARSGDRESFGVLVQRYQDGLYHLALGMVSAPAEAEDLAQETFVRAWRHLNDFRGQSSFKTWLWRILINLCRSHLRKRYLHRKLFFWKDTAPDDHEEDAAQEWADTSGADDPERTIEREKLQQAIVAARALLSRREGEVFALKYDEGLKIDEIGMLLSLSPNTVKVLLFRASRKMAEALRGFK